MNKLINLTIEQKRAIYKALEKSSPLEVGIEFGLHKTYKNKNGLRTFIYGIRREVEKDPVKFVMDLATIQKVKEVSEKRLFIKPNPTIKEETDLTQVTLMELTQGISKKAAFHLDQLLSKKRVLATPQQLAMVMGIAVDKFLLLSGKATENIAFKAKIDINVSNDKLLEQLLKLRENDRI